jgi:hypothetical protein
MFSHNPLIYLVGCTRIERVTNGLKVLKNTFEGVLIYFTYHYISMFFMNIYIIIN